MLVILQGIIYISYEKVYLIAGIRKNVFINKITYLVYLFRIIYY